MKDSLKVGISTTVNIAIDRDRTIAFMGDEGRVYATPSMVLDIEYVARDWLMEFLDETEDTVGTHVAVDHIGATVEGDNVEIEITINEINHVTKLFLILLLITIPLGAPLLSIFQSSLGVILATPDSYPGIPAGLPVGNGIIFAFFITFILLITSNILGFLIDKRTWIISFLIFVTIFTLMFTTFFINPSGIITGHWQSLGSVSYTHLTLPTKRIV